MLCLLGDTHYNGSFQKCSYIYKKGNRLDTGNYRGISILVALAKLYDIILCRWFTLWFKPKFEQAGAQTGRGCEEQILTVRLLMDIARKCKPTLYVTFIDYQKAYDKVDRYKLMSLLDSKGCGTRFLKALGASMTNSAGVIGNETFSTSAGVRQGASTSCPLFTFFIESETYITEIGNNSFITRWQHICTDSPKWSLSLTTL